MDNIEDERQRLIGQLKKLMAGIADVQKEYAALKKENPEFRIELFEESGFPQSQTGQG